MENERFQNLVLEHMARLTQEITAINIEIREIRSEIAEIKGEIAEIKGEIAEIKGEIAEIKGEIAEIKNDISKIKFKIENDIEPKIAVLFDGQQVHTAQLTRIEEKVSQHEEFIIKRIK
ncbi:MAG: hypothetical protein ACOYVD_12380 [Bacillota bacterium]